MKLTCIEVDDGLLLVGIVGKVDIGRLGVLVDGIVYLEDGIRNHNSEILQHGKQTCIKKHIEERCNKKESKLTRRRVNDVACMQQFL